jgi:hypothetical protein
VYRAKGLPYEVIVVDNASTDGTATVIRQLFPEVKLISNQQNLGPSVGRNMAIRISCNKYIAFIDSDAMITPDWSKNCVAALESNKSAGICASTIYSLRAKRIVNFPAGMLDILGIAKNFDNNEANKGGNIPPYQVFWAHGCATMIRRDVLSKIGGFDERIFIYGDDVDLSWRALNLGYVTIYEPTAIAYHMQKGSIETNITRFQYLGKRHRLRMLIKNLPLEMFIIVIPTVIVLYVLEAIFWIFFASKHKRMAQEIMKAILWNIRVLPDTIKQRIHVQKQKIINNNQLYAILSRKPFLIEGMSAARAPLNLEK